MVGERLEPTARGLGEALDRSEIDAQVDLRRHLVDVLTSRARSSDSVHGQRARRHPYQIGHDDCLGHASIVATTAAPARVLDDVPPPGSGSYRGTHDLPSREFARPRARPDNPTRWLWPSGGGSR